MVSSAAHAARRARVSHVPRFGRSSILEDQAAIEFSLGFYNALGRGLDAGGGGKVGTWGETTPYFATADPPPLPLAPAK